MPEELLTRRSALGRMLKTVAVAAGVKVADLGFLSKKADAATLTNLKVLKLKLSGYNKQVFVSEFGRTTPLTPLEQTPGFNIGAARMDRLRGLVAGGNIMGCRANMNVGGFNAADCVALGGCGYNGDNCPVMSECFGANVCSGQDVGSGGGGGSGPDSCTGVNDCNGQDCSTLSSCGDNECAGQKCPNLTDCGDNDRCLEIEDDDIVSELTGTLTQFQRDTYVQGLFKYFKVTTVDQVARQVNTMLQQRRTLMPSQVIQ